LRILDDKQLADFKSATLEILEEVGIHCPSEKALKIYAEHGGQVDFERQIVRLPADVVLDAMSHAPRFYTMGARSIDHDLKLDGTATYCATDGTGIETIDFETGNRRASTKEDVSKMARVTDYLPSMGFYWPIVSAQDYSSTAPLHELDASFNNTIKHIQSETLMGEKIARYAVEMAMVVAGDDETMRKRPPLSSLICTIAPLAQDKGGLESALVFAEAGLPVGFMSMATSGSTAPATVEGTMAIGDAEIVSAMVLIQMAYPGAPTYHSLIPGIMHPRTGAFLGSAREADLFYSGGVELAHMWGVPTLAGTGTEAETSGWESAVGIGSSMLLCVLCGADTASGLGLRETCTLLTPESLVLDTEIYHMVRVQVAGLDTSREKFALDVIKAVGPKGHFLSQPHTREYMHRLEFSELLTQPKEGGGYRNAIDVAREKTAWILENHFPEPLSEEQQSELNRILQSADSEFI
jgi:trimethylamine--corrinoid protein Co-methyltransferase